MPCRQCGEYAHLVVWIHVATGRRDPWYVCLFRHFSQPVYYGHRRN